VSNKEEEKALQNLLTPKPTIYELTINTLIHPTLDTLHRG
jgi:hypothetical protein